MNPAVTLGARHACRAPSASPRATASTGFVGSSTTDGPSSPRAKPRAMNAETRVPSTANAVVSAEPMSSLPKRARSPIAQPPPITAMTEPSVVANAFAVTTLCSSTTCGSDAESPEPMKREIPSAARASENRPIPPSPKPTAAADATIARPRRRFAKIRTLRRSQRSSRAPANGPTTEYGSSSAAKPPAMASGSAPRSGLKSTAPASPARKTPSPQLAAKRVKSRRRKAGSLSSCRGPLRRCRRRR